MTWNGRRMDYGYWLSALSRLPYFTVEAYDPDCILLYGVLDIPHPLTIGGRMEHEYGALSAGKRIR